MNFDYTSSPAYASYYIVIGLIFCLRYMILSRRANETIYPTEYFIWILLWPLCLIAFVHVVTKLIRRRLRERRGQ